MPDIMPVVLPIAAIASLLLDHSPVPADDVRVAVPPVQTVVAPTIGAGVVTTVTSRVAVAPQPVE